MIADDRARMIGKAVHALSQLDEFNLAEMVDHLEQRIGLLDGWVHSTASTPIVSLAHNCESCDRFEVAVTGEGGIPMRLGFRRRQGWERHATPAPAPERVAEPCGDVEFCMCPTCRADRRSRMERAVPLWAAWLDRVGRAFLASWRPVAVEPDLSTSVWLVANPDHMWWSAGETPEEAVVAANEWHLETYSDPERAADAGGYEPPEDPRTLLLEGDRAPVLRVFGPEAEVRALTKFVRGR